MKKIYMENVVECLKELSDPEFLKKVFGQSIITSFDELVCQLFDDTGLIDAMDDGWWNGYLTAEVKSKFAKLHSLTQSIDSKSLTIESVDDPLILKIREIAKELLDDLVNQKPVIPPSV